MSRRWRKKVETKAFEVEAILETKFENGQPSFLVKWAGYDLSSSTWELIDHLVNCQDLLIHFYEQQAAKSSSSKESAIPDSPLPDSVPPRDLLPSDSIPLDRSPSDFVARDSELSSEDSVPIPTPPSAVII
jgi:hypothetical protein